LIDEKNGSKTKHIGHGMMRFLSGKMSSRTGNVITAEALLQDIKDLVKEKIKDREFSAGEAEELSEMIAVGAIKYTILRSSVGSDIIFDSSASISFEGDSGPYLQYSAVRANSIIEKAEKEGITKDIILPESVNLIEKLITRFPDIVMRAKDGYAPQIIANYLITLSGAFNSFYASQIIVDKNNKLSPYYISLTKAFLITMTNGLWILGIKVPKKM
jgi:arginyl-tRNA synthetase